MFLRIFFLLSLFFVCSVSAHQKQLKAVPQDSTRVFFLGTEEIIIRDFQNNITDTLHINAGLNLEISNTKLVFKKNTPYLVSIGGGMVWELTNDSIKRIDNSFDHKMSIRSDVFVKNDTIFKFGGYSVESERELGLLYGRNGLSSGTRFLPFKNR